MVSFFIAALVGVGVGVLSGLLGIGGGTVMVPLFRLAFWHGAHCRYGDFAVHHCANVNFGHVEAC